MSAASPHFLHHQKLLEILYRHCKNEQPFNSDQATEVDLEFLAALQSLSETATDEQQYRFTGQTLISRIISQYTHLTPAVSRDLLWYFAGDCLHYMSDEEIALYQQVDEKLYAQADISFVAAKAAIFQPHPESP